MSDPPKAQQMGWWQSAVIIIMLVLFGALGVEAFTVNHDIMAEALSGLGIVGSLVLIWLRSSGIK